MPRQILLADDSGTIAKMVQITFAHEDYAVTVVRNGDEGNYARVWKKVGRVWKVVIDVANPLPPETKS